MDELFSIGELSHYQNISKQTLIFYDKTGLFKPAYVDPQNGYRYYSAAQLDELDTILILKKSGLSLQKIRELLEHYTTKSSLSTLRQQLSVIDGQMRELRHIRGRLAQRCDLLEEAQLHRDEAVALEEAPLRYILYRPVQSPGSLREVSISTKQCFAEAFQRGVPIFFQSGVIVPRENILSQRYTQASTAFLTTDRTERAQNLRQLPPGKCVSTYHVGDYPSIGRSYERLLDYCRKHRLRLISDSYEFCVNDYITTQVESEYITKILFYIQPLR